MAIVSLNGIEKSYTKGKETVDVLNHIDLDIEEGDFIALMGPSGSGKTTLLNLIGGIDQPTAGTVTVGGQEITGLSSKKARQVALREHRLHLPVLQPATGAVRPT